VLHSSQAWTRKATLLEERKSAMTDNSDDGAADSSAKFVLQPKEVVSIPSIPYEKSAVGTVPYRTKQ
jgi:hypothetical protein